MADREAAPWWVPDIRGWATLGMFLLVFLVVLLIAFVPTVSTSELFKTVATLIFGSGAFGLVCTFLWGGSKASVGAIETVNSIARAAPTAPAAGSTTVTATAPSETVITTAAPAPEVKS